MVQHLQSPAKQQRCPDHATEPVKWLLQATVYAEAAAPSRGTLEEVLSQRRHPPQTTGAKQRCIMCGVSCASTFVPYY
jgi:hypothetical protein